MAFARTRRILTLDEYFDVELLSEVKHEFLDGEILAMSGGSPRHNTVASNLLRILATALRASSCRALGSDQRVATPDGLYTYPDLSVFCGPMVFAGGRSTTATNPSLLVEVLSDSTRDYDRGEKLDKYKRIPSLGDILLVEPAFVRVEHWVRSGDDWSRTFHLDLEEGIALAGCRVTVPIAEIYENLDGLPD
ncbi:MAG: Uma2 family endonuclease [Myxococcota bacterium]